jgi:uncharacterized protein (TIGR02145 family)
MVAVAVFLLASYSEVVAQSIGTFTDKRDGKTYQTAKIGKQTWMAENLNYQTGNSWCYFDAPEHCEQFGRLYDWNTAKNACPAGWRLPTRQDWKDLSKAIGPPAYAGTRLKSKPPKWNGGNESGFTALPGGYRSEDGVSSGLNSWGIWWANTDCGRGTAYFRRMQDSLDENCGPNESGLSVRCVQD